MCGFINAVCFRRVCPEGPMCLSTVQLSPCDASAGGGADPGRCRWDGFKPGVQSSFVSRRQVTLKWSWAECFNRFLAQWQTKFHWGFEARFGDGLGDFCAHEDQKRVSESRLGTGEPWPGEEPVRSETGAVQKEEPAVRHHPNRAPELAPVAVRGPEQAGLRQKQSKSEEEDSWRSAERWVLYTLCVYHI